MLYDKLLQMADRHLGKIADLIRAAVLFHFDIAPHQVLSKFSDEPRLSRLRRGFRLPYPIVGIEDRASCIVLAEPTESPGLGTERLFVECLPADLEGTDEGAYSDDPAAAAAVNEAIRGHPAGSVIVSVSTLSAPSLSHEGFVLAGHLHLVVGGIPDRLCSLLHDPDPSDPGIAPMWQSALGNAMTALEEIMYVQELPGFTGWPQVLGSRRFEILPDGQIVPSQRTA